MVSWHGSVWSYGLLTTGMVLVTLLPWCTGCQVFNISLEERTDLILRI